MKKSIFHIRLKDFEIQAERLLDPRLRSKALAIISSQNQNGTIIRLSKEAQEEGLREGMPVSLARRMTHSSFFLPRNESLYTRMGNYIYQIISSYSPLTEPVKNGQYYVDMSGMESIQRSSKQAGYTILKEIEEKSSLSALLGIGSNKLITRVSTLTVPEIIYEVPSGDESRFMAPLRSQILPCSGEPRVNKILGFLFLKQVEDIQKIIQQRETSTLLFGSFHPRIMQEAMGKDLSPVTSPKHEAMIIKQKILANDTNDTAILEAVIQTLAEQIGFELRQRKQIAAAIAVEVHYSDGYKNTRKGKNSSNDDHSLVELCLRLFDQANYRRNRIRSIIIHAKKLQPYVNQLDLFADNNHNFNNLQKAIDRIRERFGAQSIQSAAALNVLIKKKRAA